MQCSKCSSHPVLIRSKVTAPSFSLQDKHCAGCGEAVSSDKGFFYCTSCSNHFICITCRLCTENHFLAKVINLGTLDSGYEGNTYGCNICQKDKKVTDNGIWHCNICFYDVCEDCLE